MQLQSVHQFSRVYVESQILDEAREIIDKLQSSAKPRVIEIEHYQDVFNRKKQNFTLQKHQPALILAQETQRFLYRGNERIDSWNQAGLFYNALVRNCVYNCDYCFLQGMHSSAHTVMFLNNRDFIDAVREQLRTESMYLSISYLSEILAFEPLFPYTRQWVEFAKNTPNFALEIRTKSDYYQALQGIKPVENVFLVWSISPEEVSRRHERGCASFHNRLFAAAKAAADGWPVKLTMDPVLAVPGWKKLYANAIEETFARIPAERVQQFSFGVFRMNHDYLERIRSVRLDAPYLHQDFFREESSDLVSYNPMLMAEIQDFMFNSLSRHLTPDKLHFVHG